MLKNAPNQADNVPIFQSCLLLKMRLSVVLEGRFTGYNCSNLLGMRNLQEEDKKAFYHQKLFHCLNKLF